MGEVCRWINFIYPGYDGEDERRGDFDGSLEHMSQMLIAMVESRGIEKFVFCGHSMGSMFMAYFVTHYRRYLEGSVSITGITDTWYIGLKTFYSLIVVSNGLNKMTKDRNKILNND
jgi:pimeloyl-ACP methyl ester carboxylesterase